MKKLLLLLFLTVSLQAQSGYNRVTEDSGISALMEKFRSMNQMVKTVPGYRLQIAQEYKSDVVYQKQAMFINRFPEWTTYVTYDQPYFKLRAGNFIDRLEAFKALKEVKKKFDSAFLVPYDISVSRIKY